MTRDEDVVRTSTEKIWVMQSRGNHAAPPVDLARIGKLVAAQDEEGLREEILRLIPEAAPDMAGTG